MESKYRAVKDVIIDVEKYFRIPFETIEADFIMKTLSRLSLSELKSIVNFEKLDPRTNEFDQKIKTSADWHES